MAWPGPVPVPAETWAFEPPGGPIVPPSPGETDGVAQPVAGSPGGCGVWAGGTDGRPSDDGASSSGVRWLHPTERGGVSDDPLMSVQSMASLMQPSQLVNTEPRRHPTSGNTDGVRPALRASRDRSHTRLPVTLYRPMYLARARLWGVAPFGDIDLPFLDEEGVPRRFTMLHGTAGVGKTTVLQVLACTRPGNAVVMGSATAPSRPFAACEWWLGVDDPERPHPLRVVTPNVKLDEEGDAAALRVREQALFDKRAREGGFVFVTVPATRWYSRQPMALHAPLRTVASWDARAVLPLDDGSRGDLTREIKQALCYAAIASALAPQTQRERNRSRERTGSIDTRIVGNAMQEVVDALVQLAGFRYLGLDAASFEPLFSSGSRVLPFEHLPHRVRHLVAFAALPIRALWAAYPGKDPRTAEGVVLIDELDLHQDEATQEQLPTVLRSCLVNVQWIVTSASSVLAAACDAKEVLALRRLPETERVQVFTGDHARTH